MDIIYALGSDGRKPTSLFEIQKNITKAIIEQQNFPETKHGLIVFGEEATELSPLEEFKNEPELIRMVEELKWPSKAESLVPPLVKSSQIFKEQGIS